MFSVHCISNSFRLDYLPGPALELLMNEFAINLDFSYVIGESACFELSGRYLFDQQSLQRRVRAQNQIQ